MNARSDKPGAPALRTFGRTGGRPLSQRQRHLVETRLPRLGVPAPQTPGTLDPLSLFAGAREAWLEIGFGGGEHMLAQAQAHPEAGLIGCEPFLEGVAKALGGMEEAGPANLRLHRGDAREVIAWLAPDSLSRVFILFPDPWPKARHHKRRLIQPGFLDELGRVCRPGARLRFATDVRSYADWAMAAFTTHPGFAWTGARVTDWTTPPGDHVTTRYEAKNIGDISPVYFDFMYMPG